MKEKNKGFTLVELLAVIVILALIALIATPIILNVISDAKKQAALESLKGYIDGAEKAIVLNKFEDEKDTTFPKVDENGCYNLKDLDKKINIKGTKPTIADDTKACFESGVVTSITGLTFSGYEVKYTKDKGYEINGKVVEKDDKKEEEKTYTVYANGTAIYYNPETGEKCDDYTEANSKTGTKNGCMKWYVFNDKEGNATVNVILDHNTTARVAYNSTGSNSEMKEVKTALENDTKNWKNTVRLITANEIAKITGNTGWNAGGEWFCLDTNKSDNTNYCAKEKGTSKYAWLFDYTYECTNFGCNISDPSTYGYWTSTSYKDNSISAWYVDRLGYLNFTNVTYAGHGIRPVITISKSDIS